jgi:hypothetical protein
MKVPLVPQPTDPANPEPGSLCQFGSWVGLVPQYDRTQLRQMIGTASGATWEAAVLAATRNPKYSLQPRVDCDPDVDVEQEYVEMLHAGVVDCGLPQ